MDGALTFLQVPKDEVGLSLVALSSSAGLGMELGTKKLMNIPRLQGPSSIGISTSSYVCFLIDLHIARTNALRATLELPEWMGDEHRPE